MEATIEVRGLRKRFGPTLAVDGLSFTVEPGQVTGFVGPNGAGKSTTIRMILGLDSPDQGEALVDGQRYALLRHPLSHVGSLIDAGALQPGRSARNHLLWLAHSQGIAARRVDQVLADAGLQSIARQKADGFSLGMRQRLGIAAALLGDPAILVLDEPFNGLDSEDIVWARGFLRSLAAEGRAVLVASHLMSELQDAATRLVVIGSGRLVADTSVAELIAAASDGRVSLRTASRTQVASVLTSAGATVAVTGADTLTVSGLVGERGGAAQRARAGILGGLDPPGHLGRGLHGADERSGRIQRRGCRGTAMTASIAPYRSQQRVVVTASPSWCELSSRSADGAFLGHHLGRRRRADRRDCIGDRPAQAWGNLSRWNPIPRPARPPPPPA